MIHQQVEPLGLTPLVWERIPYMWERLQENAQAYDDYTPLTFDEFEAMVMGPASRSWVSR